MRVMVRMRKSKARRRRERRRRWLNPAALSAAERVKLLLGMQQEMHAYWAARNRLDAFMRGFEDGMFEREVPE